MSAIAAIVYLVLVYLTVGVVAGGGVLLIRPARLDPRLAAASLPVKLLLVPGSAVFWPLVLVRALKGSA